MALSSAPSTLLSSSSNIYPSQSPFFLNFIPRTHFSKSSRTRKFACSQQTVQLDNETQNKISLVKKKRKPRPSFLEQVENKWSLKTPSLRENFPWEEQDTVDTNRESQSPRHEDVSSEKESEKATSVSNRVIISHVKTRSILPPWVHGNEPRKEGFNPDASLKVQKKVHQTEQAIDGFREHRRIEAPSVSITQNSGNLVKELVQDVKIAQKIGQFDEIGIKLVEKNEILDTVEESKDVSTVEDLSTTNRVTRSTKPSGNGDGLDRLPWERKSVEDSVKEDKLTKRNTKLAERLIPEHELKRLRNASLRMVERMKVGAAGVTQALVDAIHEKWKDDEVVKLKFEGPPSMNMKRTHEFLESRTGGLVIWRSGSSVVLYRGMTYKLDCVKSYSKHVQADESSQSMKVKRLNGATESSGLYNSNYFNSLPEEEQMDLIELNLLLDELGPRFMDWSGREPIPVDADLLPPIVDGYKTPFRLLPHGTRQALRDKEMTYLRRTARTMPPHFVLGRNRELQGLASAMAKLWEKSAIAKIAIKRGVLNTNNERMAEELRILTGGTLVSRNKEFIVFYRGNDFLPPSISSTLIEAEKSIDLQQDEEEQARQKAAILIETKAKASKQTLVAGTLAETMAATSRWGSEPSRADMEKMMRDRDIDQQASLVKTLEEKLSFAKWKMRKAEKALQKVLENQEPEDLPTDLETLTDEERFLFRRIGLSMKPYLVLGRREVFDGTIENMHLHWKYRELVKILVQRKSFAQVKHIAVSLEAESGGLLVSVDKTTKGYVIIVYRGKNYQRPLAFRPRNLLTKRQALARSIELQRLEGLKHHVLELEENIEKLKQELDDMMTASDNGAEIFGPSTNSACNNQ